MVIRLGSMNSLSMREKAESEGKRREQEAKDSGEAVVKSLQLEVNYFCIIFNL